MPRRLLIESAEGTAVLEEVPVRDEAELQEKMKDNPDLIPIEEFGLPGPMMVVGRETPVASGSVDLVGLTRDGEVVIIEFKTGPQNTDFRHTLAQLLDYGSDLWEMDVDAFESTVALRYFHGERCPDASSVRRAPSLAAAARATWADISDDELGLLRDTLAARLRAGDFYYVICAQRFVPQILRTAKYLNEKIPGSSFYAVELVKFDTTTVSGFEARTLLRPEAAGSRQRRDVLREDSFLDSMSDDAYRGAIEQLIETARGLGFRLEWGSKALSIRVPTADRSEPVTAAWVHRPGEAGWLGLRDLVIGFSPDQCAEYASARPAFEALVERIGAIPGVEPIGQAYFRTMRLPPAVAAARIAEVCDALVALAESIGTSG